MRPTLSTLAVTALLFGCGAAPAELPDLPATKAVEQTQGGQYWAVYLAADADQELLHGTRRRLTAPQAGTGTYT